MVKSLEVVKTGIGMPAFISEDSYIDFVVREGIDIREARKFAIAGCLDLMLPGASRNQAFGMAVVPMILELALFNGKEPKSGILYGPQTGELTSFDTFEDFYQAFLKQIHHIVGQIVEEHNILIVTQRDLYPDVVHSAFLRDGMEVARDGLDRKMLLENGCAINVVGMANAIDSLAAMKKLIYDDKTVTIKDLLAALTANWEGYEEIRTMCLNAPKYGNNDDSVDQIAVRFWHDLSGIVRTFRSAFDSVVLPTAISISAHAPGGSMTGPTPDGRLDGETFADGSISPEQGKDKNGPLAVLQSGMKINQDEYMATLFNMKFHPSALETQSDLTKLAGMVKTYLTNGGKQIQFNVVDKEMLVEAKKEKEKHRDLIVRVAGYSAYYVTLTPRVQDEIILRTEQSL
jgi:formate C-acetyltransferase